MKPRVKNHIKRYSFLRESSAKTRQDYAKLFRHFRTVNKTVGAQGLASGHKPPTMHAFRKFFS